MATQAKKNFLQSIIDAGANSVSPSIAIPYKIAQDPGKFAQNALGGTGELVKSTLGIPGAVINSVKNGTESQDLQNLGTGIAEQYKQIAKHPVDSFMSDPVGTSLAITPAGGVLGKAGDVGKVAEASKVAENAGKVADTAKAAETLQPINKVKNVSGMNNAPKAAPDAVNNYSSIFQVPRNVVQRMNIKPDQIIHQLINDGVTNVKSLDDLEHVANTVTGENGVFPRINRMMLQDIKEPVSYSPVKATVRTAINDKLAGASQGVINDVTARINRTFPAYDQASGSLHGMVGDKAHAGHLFDTSQELGALEKMYTNKAHSAMGDLINPEYDRAAQVVGEVKNSLQDILDNKLSGEKYQSYKTDPRVVEELQKLPPAIAKRWLDNAKQFRDGRAIQAPYVGLQKMIDHTKDAQMSAFTKWTNQMQNAQPSQAVTNALVHPVDALQGAAMGGLQKAISPLIDKTPEDIMAAKTSGHSAALKPAGTGVLPAIKGVIGTGAQGLGPVALGQEELSNNANAQNNGIDGQNGNNNAHIPPIAQYLRSSKLDETGHYSLPQPPAPVEPLTPGTPEYTRAQASLPGGARQFMTNAPVYTRALNGVADDLKTMPVNLLLSFKKPQEMLDYASDPKNPYAQQVADLTGLNQIYSSAYSSVTGEKPSEQELINPGMSQGQLQQRIARMIDFVDNSYKQFYQPFAQTSSVPTTQKSGSGIVQYSPPPAQDSTAGMVQPGLQQTINSLPPIGQQAFPQ